MVEKGNPEMRLARYPLYLGKNAHCLLDDGPSIVVSYPGVAPLRFPFRIVSRIMVDQRAGMDSALMLAILATGIPVTWVDPDGKGIAVALPVRCYPTTLAESMAIMMARADWKQCYHAWLAAQYAMAIHSLAARFNIDAGGEAQARIVPRLLQHFGIPDAWGMKRLRQWQAMVIPLLLEYWQSTGESPEITAVRLRN